MIYSGTGVRVCQFLAHFPTRGLFELNRVLGICITSG